MASIGTQATIDPTASAPLPDTEIAADDPLWALLGGVAPTDSLTRTPNEIPSLVIPKATDSLRRWANNPERPEGLLKQIEELIASSRVAAVFVILNTHNISEEASKGLKTALLGTPESADQKRAYKDLGVFDPEAPDDNYLAAQKKLIAKITHHPFWAFAHVAEMAKPLSPSNQAQVTILNETFSRNFQINFQLEIDCYKTAAWLLGRDWGLDQGEKRIDLSFMEPESLQKIFFPALTEAIKPALNFPKQINEKKKKVISSFIQLTQPEYSMDMKKMLALPHWQIQAARVSYLAEAYRVVFNSSLYEAAQAVISPLEKSILGYADSIPQAQLRAELQMLPEEWLTLDDACKEYALLFYPETTPQIPPHYQQWIADFKLVYRVDPVLLKQDLPRLQELVKLHKPLLPLVHYCVRRQGTLLGGRSTLQEEISRASKKDSEAPDATHRDKRQRITTVTGSAALAIATAALEPTKAAGAATAGEEAAH